MDASNARRQRAEERARPIRLAVFDVDGVMTDGGLYFTNDGNEIKRFNVMDGLGLKWLMSSGIDVAIITGRQSQLVERRARDLGITHLVQGREDKRAALHELLDRLGIGARETAYLGDDLPDLSAIRWVGLGGAVANAHPLVKMHAAWIGSAKGGEGAVREFCEFLLVAQEKWASIQATYLDQ